jgi:hypothetical protein
MAQWLTNAGFAAGAENPHITDPLGRMVWNLDLARTVNDPRADAVHKLLLWLWTEVLPELDGRRELERKRMLQEGPEPGGQIDEKYANLFFGSDDGKVAGRVDALLSKMGKLRHHVADAAARRAMRERNAASALELAEAYQAWVRAGQRFLALIEPQQPVPRTKGKWGHCLSAMREILADAGFSATEISRLTLSTGVKAVNQAQYRQRQRTRAA